MEGGEFCGYFRSEVIVVSASWSSVRCCNSDGGGVFLRNLTWSDIHVTRVLGAVNSEALIMVKGGPQIPDFFGVGAP